MIFYHGTSDSMGYIHRLLPPIITGCKREDWRSKHTDVVFFTPSVPSAIRYARKACAKYGGNPVIFQVSPIGEIVHIGNGDWVADSAHIIHKKYLGDE